MSTGFVGDYWMLWMTECQRRGPLGMLSHARHIYDYTYLELIGDAIFCVSSKVRRQIIPEYQNYLNLLLL